MASAWVASQRAGQSAGAPHESRQTAGAPCEPHEGHGVEMKPTAFGLELGSQTPLSFLDGASRTQTKRPLALSVVDGDAEQLAWPASAELVCDERQPDGSVIFQIEAHPEAGYMICGSRFGVFLLSADGRRLVCLPKNRPAAAWQRLLIAQVLPFAALLQGFEVFHASAIVDRGQAIAIAGPSRAGKTSVALELCRRGAGFLADDVLALERAEGGLVGYPGAPVAGLDHAEAQRLERSGDMWLGEVVAVNARERLVRMCCAEPTPLGTLFLLDRRGDEPRFEPLTDPQLMLAGTFNSVLRTPSRLRGLLDVCALLAHRRVERVLAGPHVDAAQLATAIERRLEAAP